MIMKKRKATTELGPQFHFQHLTGKEFGYYITPPIVKWSKIIPSLQLYLS